VGLYFIGYECPVMVNLEVAIKKMDEYEGDRENC
jgi:hypothetical protein